MILACESGDILVEAFWKRLILDEKKTAFVKTSGGSILESPEVSTLKIGELVKYNYRNVVNH